MFTTNVQQWTLNLRSLNAQDVDEEGNIWFITSKDTGVTEAMSDAEVQVFYSNATRSEFLSLIGKATLSHDPVKIRKLKNPLARMYDDQTSHVNLVCIQPTEVFYWDARYNEMVAV
jgi:general stress protein 26